MRSLFSFNLFSVLVCIGLGFSAQAQNVQITLGPDEIGENQGWTITVTVHNERLKSYDNFPDIEGFRKRGTSNQSMTSMMNGQVSSSQSVIMNYASVRQGLINVPSFTMKVNDKPITVNGKKVKVGPPVQQRDPFKSFFDKPDDFFGRGETEYVDIKDDAFVALTTSKDEVYVGEGFTTTISFFVSDDNQAQLTFYKVANQLAEILKKVKPADCWEEDFQIENIEGESVMLNGKRYNQYKIYQSTLYPLNAEPVVFPAFDLQMIKYKVAKNPSAFGPNRKEDFKTFTSKPKTVRVKELPPHPLRDVVAVGDYHLDEHMRTTNLETGISTGYEFNVYGEGNISAIEKPIMKSNNNFEFYEPNVRQNINREQNRVTGTKSFGYFLIPKEPGQFNMGDYFQWVFFNPKQKRYDTLRSQLSVNVKGESRKNEVIQSSDMGNFYDQITTTDNQLQMMSDTRWQRWAFNGFIIVILGLSVFFLFRKSHA
ncbi:MAG TPA: BatD family protein [Ohtaekwangia sp.]